MKCEDWAAPYLAIAIHFHSDLALLNVTDSTRSQTLAGAVQETDDFSSIFSDGSYVLFRFRSGLDFQKDA